MTEAVLVRVVDECGRPIPDAGVEVARRSGQVDRSTTGNSGHATFAAGPVDIVEASASADGYRAVERIAWPPSSGEGIVLLASNAVEGEVWSAVPGFDPREVRVVAIPGGAPRYEVSVSDLESESASSVPDEQGRFRFACLDPDRHVSLLAGGNGWIAVKEEGTAWPHVDPVEKSGSIRIELRRLYAALLKCSDHDGAPVRFPSPGAFGGNLRSWSEVPGAAPKMEFTGECVLAGADPSWTSLPESTLLRMFVAGSSATELGPNGFLARIPGYKEATTSYSAPLVTGQIGERIPVTFLRTAKGWGSVLVRFVDDSGRPPGNAPPEGKLVLQDDQGAEIAYGLTSGRPEVVVEDVPAGRYRLCFRPRQPGRQFPTAVEEGPWQEVGPTVVEFSIPITDFGDASIELVTPQGTPYAGPFNYMLSKVTHDAQTGGFVKQPSTTIRSLPAPPYRLRGLERGTYALRCLKPSQAEKGPEGLEKETVFEVNGSATIEVRIVVSDPENADR